MKIDNNYLIRIILSTLYNQIQNESDLIRAKEILKINGKSIVNNVIDSIEKTTTSENSIQRQEFETEDEKTIQEFLNYAKNKRYSKDYLKQEFFSKHEIPSNLNLTEMTRRLLEKKGEDYIYKIIENDKNNNSLQKKITSDDFDDYATLIWKKK